jgi:lipoate-protein ligase A
MALDEALLHDAAASGRPTLRLYRWAPACLSFGRNEPALARYDRAAIERLGLDVVRRPTGGRAVWHDAELTYAVAAPIAEFGTLAHSHRAIHARLADALRTLGVPAELAPSRRPASLSAGPCFAAPVGGEVLADGKKVIGSAQVRRGSAFLQHGSILLDGTQEVIQAVSRQPSAISAASSLTAVLGRPVGFVEVADAILSTWGTPFTSLHQPPQPPPSSTAFASPAWTWRR